jgi:glycosyltransferase 2 family protein
MRKFIVALVLLLAVVFIFLRLSELQSILETLQKSNWLFLSVALIFECLWLYNLSITFGRLYRLVDLREGRLQLFLMTTAANFVNVVTTTAGVGGMAVFMDSARQRKLSTGRVLVVGALYILYDYTALMCLVALGFVVLIRRNSLQVSELIAAVILLALMINMAVLLYLGYRSAEKLGNVLAWLSRQVNRLFHPFIHRDYLKEENAHIFAREIAEGILLIRGKRKDLVWPFLFSLVNKCLLACIMAFTFLTVETSFSVGTVLSGVSIASLFLIVSPTPSGLGIVEGVLPLVLNMLQIPLGAAVLITLIYRAVTFWFPLLVGIVTFRFLGTGKKLPSVESNQQEKENPRDMDRIK